MTHNNRSLTLTGANKIFAAVGIEIERHPMGHYTATYQGQHYEQPTLTALCQQLAAEAPWIARTVRVSQAGHNVTDLPGLWDESDTEYPVLRPSSGLP